MKISEHFEDWELLSPRILEQIAKSKVGATPLWYISTKQIEFLEYIRSYFSKPVHVNYKDTLVRRGICTEQECIEADRSGVMLSDGRKYTLTQHCHLGAFDITIDDVTPNQLATVIRIIATRFGIGGLGVSVKDNFCHVDFRGGRELVEWVY